MQHMFGESVERIMFAGRWKSTQSLQCYIQETVAYLVHATVDGSLQDSMSQFRTDYQPILDAPPPFLS